MAISIKVKSTYAYMVGTATVNYADADLDFNFPANNVKILNDGSSTLNVIFNQEVKGTPDADLDVLAGDEIDLKDLKVSRIAVKGSDLFRVIAYV